ncbi:MAG TPA: DUF4261 domain-containing protein [Myxococcales bacterium]
MESLSFTQCACVLFEQAPKMEEVVRALAEWPVSGYRKQGAGEYDWALCGPGVVLDLRGEGFAVVDVVDRPWPDDVQTALDTPALASAWRAGAFGPYSSPGTLARALDQAGEDGSALSRHGGFIRIRSAFAGKGPPPKRRGGPTYDLMTLTEVATPLMRLEGALAFFVPAGEALRDRKQLEEVAKRKVGGPAPVDLWTSVRAIALPPEGGKTWLLLDVVGMNQLGLPDQEAIFAEGEEQPEAVEAMLRNACVHLLSAPIAPGSTSDDAKGRRWRAREAVGIVAPPRPVLRWLPEESAHLPEATLARLAEVSTAGTGSDRGTAGPGSSSP